MQEVLRHDVVRTLFNAEPVDVDELDKPIETELTRAARGSVDNADKILQVEEFNESDFRTDNKSATKQVASKTKKQKQRKAERQHKSQGKKRKK